jgi:hypothetical protein
MKVFTADSFLYVEKVPDEMLFWNELMMNDKHYGYPATPPLSCFPFGHLHKMSDPEVMWVT